MPRTTFLYHTEAVGASGFISLPVYDQMPLQASVASAIGASFGKARVDNFRHLDYLTIGSMESHVVSSFSKKDNAYGTLASVVVEDLNNLNMVTCRKMVSRLTGKHDKCDVNGSKPGSFILHGTHFDGLKIGGHTIELELATGLFSELSTWNELTTKYQENEDVRNEVNKYALYKNEDPKSTSLPVRNGVFACSLAIFPEKLPRGFTKRDHGIYVPHFGEVYAGELYITATSRRLRMLHLELGCSVEGCNGISDSGSNGQGTPGN